MSSYNTIGRMSETSVEVLKSQQQRGCVADVLGDKKGRKKKESHVSKKKKKHVESILIVEKSMF